MPQPINPALWIQTILPVVLICLLLASPDILSAQQDFELFDKNQVSSKKLKKLAEEQNKPIFMIIHTDMVSWSSVLLIDEVDSVRWILEQFATTVYDYDSDNKSINSFIDARIFSSNPFYVIIRHDGTILATSKKLESSNDLNAFARNGLKKFNTLSKLLTAYNADKKDLNKIKALNDFYVSIKDYSRAEEMTDAYLRRHDNPAEDLGYLYNLAQNCECGKRLNRELIKYRALIIGNYGKEAYHTIRKKDIITSLRKQDLLEPYYVWQAYEAEFGDVADKYYRQFAIEYYQYVLPDKEALLDELYDYLTIYNKTPWVEQDGYFELALEKTTSKLDLEELLDLVSYQIFREKNFRNLDFRAGILYRLGQKERALALLQEVAALSLEKKVNYKSMIYDLSTKK